MQQLILVGWVGFLVSLYELFTATEDADGHQIDGDAEGFGDFLIREALVHVEHEASALVGGNKMKGALDGVLIGMAWGVVRHGSDRLHFCAKRYPGDALAPA